MKDYAVEEIRILASKKLDYLDEILDDDVAVDLEDVLENVYSTLHEIVELAKNFGDEFDDHETDLEKVMVMKRSLTEAGYDFFNLEVFAPVVVEYDPIIFSHIKYLERSGYHFHGLNSDSE